MLEYIEFGNEKLPTFIYEDKTRHHIVKVSLFSKDLFTVWKKNRKPDELRIQEIANDILLRKPSKIDGEIYGAKIKSRGNKIEIYDGQHRYLAIRYLLQNKLIACDHIYVSIIVKEFDNDESVKEDFIRLNKSVPISEADMNYNPERTELIHNIVNRFSTIYPNLKSGNRFCKRPNFNQDILTDQLYKIVNEIFDNSSKINITSDYLWNNIQIINNDIGNKYNEYYNLKIRKNGVSEAMFEKAKREKCYLFLENDWTSQLVSLILK